MFDVKSKILENTTNVSTTLEDVEAKVESIISRTFIWLWVSLLIAFWVGYYMSYLIMNNVIPVYKFTWLFLISAIWWFVLVVVMSWLWEKLSYVVLAVLFIIFAILEGIGLTGFFLSYTWNSIINAFLTTSLLFFVLAFLWNVLKFDITKVGNILLWWLIALILGLLINFFWQNSTFNIYLNIFALIIFSGLVIWDIAVLKQMALLQDRRVEIVMALALYLDFINIFITLLKLFGNNRE